MKILAIKDDTITKNFLLGDLVFPCAQGIFFSMFAIIHGGFRKVLIHETLILL